MRVTLRLPGEFEPTEAIWVVTPHNRETWPGCFDQARGQFEQWVDAMSLHIAVRRVERLGIATNDSWMRDFGPLFVIDHTPGSSPNLLVHDFRFNSWGDKYEMRELDDAATRKLCDHFNWQHIEHTMVLEGGSIDADGQGTLLTTEQCLLNVNRNPHMTRDDIEATLGQAMGVSQIVWLPGGIEGDDTDGHIDDVARFIAPGLVACVVADRHHPDHDMTCRNRQALASARDAQGKQLTIIDLPCPAPIVYDYPADRFGQGGEAPVPASYANFLFANDHLFVPIFDQSSDDVALSVLDDALPGHTIVPIQARHLVVGLGALHCLSMQQPVCPASGNAKADTDG